MLWLVILLTETVGTEAESDRLGNRWRAGVPGAARIKVVSI